MSRFGIMDSDAKKKKTQDEDEEQEEGINYKYSIKWDQRMDSVEVDKLKEHLLQNQITFSMVRDDLFDQNVESQSNREGFLDQIAERNYSEDSRSDSGHRSGKVKDKVFNFF